MANVSSDLQTVNINSHLARVNQGLMLKPDWFQTLVNDGIWFIRELPIDELNIILVNIIISCLTHIDERLVKISTRMDPIVFDVWYIVSGSGLYTYRTRTLAELLHLGIGG
jgi:hypothetical protein